MNFYFWPTVIILVKQSGTSIRIPSWISVLIKCKQSMKNLANCKIRLWWKAIVVYIAQIAIYLDICHWLS